MYSKSVRNSPPDTILINFIMKTNIELLFFPGFYESWAYSPDMEYYGAKEYVYDMLLEHGVELEEEDFKFDFEAYKKAFCEAFISHWKSISPDCLKSIDSETFKVLSPSFYNYSVDRLFVDVELADNWLESMIDFIKTNKKWFAEQIEKDWTPRSDFISIMKNTVDEWIDRLSKKNDCYISHTLKYMVIKHYEYMVIKHYESVLDDVLEDFKESIFDDLSFDDYFQLTESGKAKIKEAEESDEE